MNAPGNAGQSGERHCGPLARRHPPQFPSLRAEGEATQSLGQVTLGCFAGFASSQ